MLELNTAKKQKVTLTDYNFQEDIENRIILSDITPFDLEVISEILFSPLKISLKKLSRNMDVADEKLLPLLEKLKSTRLLTIDGDQIVVDKDRRKYFEFEISRFDPDFKPDLEFIQGILRKVPIHILPVWYALPRTSNNIFESIVEKYLLTPQIFQRYIADLQFADPVISQIVQDLFLAKDQILFSSDVIQKYNLTRRGFEEIILLLEFHFAAFLSYRKQENHWIEVITPVYEWQQYLKFIRDTETPVLEEGKVENKEVNFAFLDEMNRILSFFLKTPSPLSSFEERSLTKSAIQKLQLLQLARVEKDTLYPSDGAKMWIEKPLETQALYLYRHPANLSSLCSNERQIREGEKSIRRVSHGKWVLFDDFLKGVTVSFGEGTVMMKKVGKQYRYTVPVQGESEKKWLRTIVFEWLFEMGMISIGTFDGKDCFSVTSFGRFCFEE